jgi:hypothetical protein
MKKNDGHANGQYEIKSEITPARISKLKVRVPLARQI